MNYSPEILRIIRHFSQKERDLFVHLGGEIPAGMVHELDEWRKPSSDLEREKQRHGVEAKKREIVKRKRGKAA